MEALVQRFSPQLYFDSSENYFPERVTDTLLAGTLLDAHDDPVPFSGTAAERTAALFSASAAHGINEALDSLWIDFPGAAPTAIGSGDNDPVRLYATAILDDEQIAITYYIHYRYSNWCQWGGLNNHEGDWETAFVYLSRSAPGQPFKPLSVAYSQHETYDLVPRTNTAGSLCLGGQLADWSDLLLAGGIFNRTHPRLFVGLGGHASYFGPESVVYPTPWGIFVEVCDGQYPLGQSTNVVLLPRGPDAADTAYSWLLFPGHWGQEDLSSSAGSDESCNGSDSGPLGPIFGHAVGGSPGTRWFDPVGWPTEGALNFCSYKPPDLAGFAAMAICFSGSSEAEGFIPPPEECLVSDFDSDGDVDSTDFGDFAAPLTVQQGAIVLQPGPGEAKDIWTTSVYCYCTGPGPGGGLDNEDLRVGGWGDEYYSLLEFDLTGLPNHASAALLYLYCHAQDGGGTTMYLDRITEFWDWKTQGTGQDHERLWWADRPSAVQWEPNPVTNPTPGQWYAIEITELYNAWQAGVHPNYGIQLRPVNHGANNFNTFYSSDYLGDPALRPKLVVEP